jgi:hypothetical protein
MSVPAEADYANSSCSVYSRARRALRAETPALISRIRSRSERMASVSRQLSYSSGLTSTAAGRPLRVMMISSSRLSTSSTRPLSPALASESDSVFMVGGGSRLEFWSSYAGAERASTQTVVCPRSCSPGFVFTYDQTLRNVAQAVWGDGSLWYILADANALTAASVLAVGQVLVVPNVVTNIHNSASTFQVYDAGEHIGDVSPTLPAPPPPPQASQDGCGGMGIAIMVVVAIVVTIYTAGAATALLSASISGVGAGAMTAEMAVLGGAATTGGILGAAAGVVGAAIGGAVGSVASQEVGRLTGNVDKFSWTNVGLSAIGGGVTAGLGGTNLAGYAGLSAGSDAALALNAAAGNSLTQQIARGTGYQDGFNWRSVAVSAIAAPIASRVADFIQGDLVSDIYDGIPYRDGTAYSRWAGDFGTRLTTSLVTGVATQAVRRRYNNGQLDYGQLAADAFGSTLGNSLAEDLARVGQQQSAQEGVDQNSVRNQNDLMLLASIKGVQTDSPASEVDPSTAAADPESILARQPAVTWADRANFVPPGMDLYDVGDPSNRARLEYDRDSWYANQMNEHVNQQYVDLLRAGLSREEILEIASRQVIGPPRPGQFDSGPIMLATAAQAVDPLQSGFRSSDRILLAYPGREHGAIFDEVYPEAGPEERGIARRAIEGIDVDQRDEYQAAHAMDGVGNQLEARAKANMLIRLNLQQAWNYLDQGNQEAAVFHRELASHTPEDRTSPEHQGLGGSLTAWNAGDLLGGVAHFFGELFYPGSNSEAVRAAQDIRQMYESRYIPGRDLLRYGIDKRPPLLSR